MMITKKVIFIFFLCLLINTNYASLNQKNDLKKIIITNFDSAMHLTFKDNINLRQNKDLQIRLNFFRNIFIKNLKNIKKLNKKNIPKLLHQIWLGSNFPKKYQDIADKWKTLHPDWQYKLWTDSNIKELFPLFNQEFFDKSTNFAEKSDILRYEILYKFGGIYFDTDYECFKSFDILSNYYEFFAGLEPLNISASFIGNAIIGCCPKHSIMENCIKTIKDYRTYEKLPMRTGPAHLTRSVIKTGYLKNIMIFPVGYLYPFSVYGKKIDRAEANQYLYKESLGIHYWWLSWK